MRESSEIIPFRGDDEDTFVQISISTRQILCEKPVSLGVFSEEPPKCVRDIWHRGNCSCIMGDPMMEYTEGLGLIVGCPVCGGCIIRWDSEISRWVDEDNCEILADIVECPGCDLYDIRKPDLDAVEAFELEDESRKTNKIIISDLRL